MIECRGIDARVGNFTIRNVSFVLAAGTHAVLMGPTASGKTTLLELIAGAIVPDAGKILVSGVDVTTTAPELRGVGMVPQHGYLFPHLNVRQNIQYGVADAITALNVAQRFGIGHLVNRSVASLSGGERQLVALCRAIAPRPVVLLLDEPLSALDDQRRNVTLGEFDKLQAEYGFTVLHVTHQPTDAGLLTTRLDMANGELTVAAAPLT